MKRHSFSIQLVVLAIASFGMTSPVAATHPAPAKGSFVGSYTVAPSIPPSVDVVLKIAGNATQFGNFTAVFPARVDLSTVPSIAVGTYTFTAANGDTLKAYSRGEAVLVAPNILYIVDRATVTGGTGRFFGARGELVIERLANQLTLTTVGTIDGTLFAADASNP